jgi:alkyl hydroperoxide reductase subunit AhpF
MSLLSPADQEWLREAFGTMTRPVRLLFFAQALDCDTCPITREILDELEALSDKVSVEEVNSVLEADRAAGYGIDRAPAVAIVYEGREGTFEDSHIRFLGAPSGYEFMSLVQAVLLAGGRRSMLSEESRTRIVAIDRPITIRVFTTPT